MLYRNFSFNLHHSNKKIAFVIFIKYRFNVLLKFACNDNGFLTVYFLFIKYALVNKMHFISSGKLYLKIKKLNLKSIFSKLLVLVISVMFALKIFSVFLECC